MIKKPMKGVCVAGPNTYKQGGTRGHGGCSNHTMVEISILRVGNKANSKTTIEKQAHLCCSGTCLEEFRSPEGRRGHGEMIIYQGSSPLNSRTVHPDEQKTKVAGGLNEQARRS